MNNFLLKYLCFVIIILLVFSCSTYTKKQRTKEGITYYYYNKGKLTEIRNTKDGIRDGITEVIYDDGIEYTREVAIYKHGILQKVDWYSKDSTLRYNHTFSEYGGELIESWVLTNIDSANNLHYIKKVTMFPCRFMQYHIINDVVVDSILVQFPEFD
ncbi:MAG: hypothetical protein FWC39_06405 [Bacteroidetes bacterium]|nr:hypothetical protein [Bacteroidota bacterium]